MAARPGLQQMVFKICTASQWDAAVAAGAFHGAAIDLKDGFIHLSAAHQLHETARRHFANQQDLVVIALEAADLGPQLRWETSRGGDLFPHLYGPLPVRAARWVKPAPLDADGIPMLPEGAV